MSKVQGIKDEPMRIEEERDIKSLRRKNTSACKVWDLSMQQMLHILDQVIWALNIMTYCEKNIHCDQSMFNIKYQWLYWFWKFFHDWSRDEVDRMFFPWWWKFGKNTSFAFLLIFLAYIKKISPLTTAPKWRTPKQANKSVGVHLAAVVHSLKVQSYTN